MGRVMPSMTAAASSTATAAMVRAMPAYLPKAASMPVPAVRH
jgi:hypothetical protein